MDMPGMWSAGRAQPPLTQAQGTELLTAQGRLPLSPTSSNFLATGKAKQWETF